MEKITYLIYSIVMFLMCFWGHSQEISVSGNVISSSDGNPLPGVSIVADGTTTGTQSDFDGNYTIEVSSNAILIFSYIGFATKEIAVNNQTNLNVSLEESTENLDEVVVIGYGTASKKKLVSSVSSIKSDVIENQPVARVDQALQGRATGVEVVSNSGAPGTGSTIRIRGNSSINGDNNPLFVVDGFIVGTNFNLNSINVNDIESIEVLKDATALAIYGTRGASGVVLLTTKSGKGASKKPIININSYITTEVLANKIDILGGVDYINYVNEASQFVPGPGVDVNGTNVPIGIRDTSLPLLYDDPESVITTDWIDLISRTGTISNTDISVLGNTENTNYYVSMNYFNQEGILKNSGLERVTLRSNLDVDISDRFEIGLRLNLSTFRQENNKVNFPQIISSVLPVRKVYDDDGDFTGINPIRGGLERNPVADIQLRDDHDLVSNIIANTYFEYEILNGLKLKSSIGATLNYFKRNIYQPGALPERILNNNIGGFGSISTSQTKDILNENTFTYNRTFGGHDLTVLGGFTAQKITTEVSNSSAEGFPNDVVRFNNLSLGSNPETYQVESGYVKRTLTSFLGRLNYSYLDRYVVTLVGRQDGSSVFETGNKYSFFPSAGIAWNIDEEGFMENVYAINTFKLRGSYGVVGEQGVDPYNSFNLFNSQFNYFNETLVPAVIIGTPASNDLQWETTKQLDIGMELGLFNNRITFEADYYKKTTEDLLLFKDLPNTAGNRTLENVGSVENAGFEFLINTTNISNDSFQWNTTLTVSTNKSKVLDIGEEEFINLQSTGEQGGPSARLIVGESLPAFVGAEYLGTYKNAQEIADDATIGRAFVGGPRYRDLDGDGVINENDFVVLGSPQPDFFGGIRNTLSYKDLALDVFFQGSYGSEIFNTVTQRSFFGRNDENLDPIVLNRYMDGVNETSDIPRAGSSPAGFNPNSSVNIEDGSFLRLRSVTLSYDFPLKEARLDKIFSGLNLYITGRNLLLISDFRLGDPEVNNFTAGSGFSSVSQGFASGQYPYGRSITTGIKMQF